MYIYVFKHVRGIASEQCFSVLNLWQTLKFLLTDYSNNTDTKDTKMSPTCVFQTEVFQGTCILANEAGQHRNYGGWQMTV